MLDLESTELWLALATGTAESSAVRVFWVFGSPANMPYPTARCLVPADVSSPAPPRAPSTLGLIGSQARANCASAAGGNSRSPSSRRSYGTSSARIDVRDPAILVAGQRRSMVSRNSWTSRTAIAPSPTADATRLTEPLRTSPTAKTPARPVSSMLL